MLNHSDLSGDAKTSKFLYNSNLNNFNSVDSYNSCTNYSRKQQTFPLVSSQEFLDIQTTIV